MNTIRPKTIYLYEDKELIKHRVTSQCMIEVVEHSPDGTRYRCRASNHDFYGYAMLKQAKAFEIKEATKRISYEQLWRDKLRGHGPKAF